MKHLIVLAGCLAAAGAYAQQGDGTRAAFATNIFKPNKVDATPERMAAIKAPAGFKVTPFATGLKNARILAVAPNGDVYLSRRDQGDVLLLRDANNDGVADGPPITVAARRRRAWSRHPRQKTVSRHRQGTVRCRYPP